MKRQEIADQLIAALAAYGKTKSSTTNVQGLLVPEPGKEDHYEASASQATFYLQQPMITLAKLAKIVRAIHLPAQHYFAALEEILQLHVASSSMIKTYEMTQQARSAVAGAVEYVSPTAAQWIKPSEETQRSDAEKIIGSVLQTAKLQLKSYYQENQITLDDNPKLRELAVIYLELLFKVEKLTLGKQDKDAFQELLARANYEFTNEYNHRLFEAMAFLKPRCRLLNESLLANLIVKIKFLHDFFEPTKLPSQKALSTKLDEVFDKVNLSQKKVNAEKEREKAAKLVLEKGGLVYKMQKMEQEIAKTQAAHTKELQQHAEKITETKKTVGQQQADLTKVQQDLMSMRGEKEHLAQELQRHEEKNTETKKTLEQQQAELARMQEELMSIRDQKEHLVQQVASLEAEKKSAEEMASIVPVVGFDLKLASPNPAQLAQRDALSTKALIGRKQRKKKKHDKQGDAGIEHDYDDQDSAASKKGAAKK